MSHAPQTRAIETWRANPLLVLLSSLSFLFFLVLLRNYYQDAALIIGGEKIVWNPGERIEGCPSFFKSS